jgi:L-ectoine synthase
MIIRSLDDVKGTKGDMHTEDWSSQRFLHREDGMGFTLTDTLLDPSMDDILWYKHHFEACYCLEGEGTVEDLTTGEVHEIRAGTMYALDKHDRHRLRPKTRMRLICVFNPPLTGGEIHDADGSYRPG